MTIGKKIKWEKLKYDINGEAAGIKDLSSGKIDKSEHLFGRFRKKMTNIFKKLPLYVSATYLWQNTWKISF